MLGIVEEEDELTLSDVDRRMGFKNWKDAPENYGYMCQYPRCLEEKW